MRNRHTPRFEPVKILLPCYLSAPISNANILWGGAATALLGATLAEWQRKRAEEEAARLAALRNSGGGDEGGDGGAANKRMKALAKANPTYARALAQEQSLRAEIAKVTAQEQKAWTRENTLKVEATQAYMESENKGQYLKQELQNIRVEEAEYRAEEKAKEQAMQDYRTGEKNAVAIAEEYAIEAQRIGERNAVAIAEDYEERMREQALQTQRLGEQYAVEIAEDYEARKQEWLNAVDAARWAGVASVAQGRQESDEQAAGWLSSIPLVGSALNNVWQVSSLKNIWEENANKSIVLPRLTPKNIATAVLTVALGYTGIQWVNNIASNPHIFDEATRNFEAEFQQLLEIHPRTEENTRPDYLFTNPLRSIQYWI